jgi:uncharacterized protein YbbC (DUF1343 family)
MQLTAFLNFVMCGLFSLQSVAAQMPDTCSRPIPGAWRTGEYFPMLQGKAMALVANQSSCIQKKSLADSLYVAGFSVQRIFVPEHGYIGRFDAGALVPDDQDTLSGTRITSLYGAKKKPSARDLENIDLVLFDLQDVGVRFYTYISTLHYVMEACAEQHIPLIVLDRPNPLGFYVDGPVLDSGLRSFVGMHPIPIVYGLTIGELACMINGEGWLGNHLSCDLTVIPCENYSHKTRYQLSISPSPNLNSMEAVYLYPSLCLFEGTVMSVGRGTESPFRVIGHPRYPASDFQFVPRCLPGNRNPKFLNDTCYGIDLRTLTRDSLQKIDSLNLHWLIQAYREMGAGEAFFTASFDRLAGNRMLRGQIIAGLTELQIRQGWQADIKKFKAVRMKYLLYPD